MQIRLNNCDCHPRAKIKKHYVSEREHFIRSLPQSQRHSILNIKAPTHKCSTKCPNTGLVKLTPKCVSSSSHHPLSAECNALKSFPSEKKGINNQKKEIKGAMQTVKSSRACAPLLSFRASAECMVMQAFIKRFSNSTVSIKSEFLMKRSGNKFNTSCTLKSLLKR